MYRPQDRASLKLKTGRPHIAGELSISTHRRPGILQRALDGARDLRRRQALAPSSLLPLIVSMRLNSSMLPLVTQAFQISRRYALAVLPSGPTVLVSRSFGSESGEFGGLHEERQEKAFTGPISGSQELNLLCEFEKIMLAQKVIEQRRCGFRGKRVFG